MKRSLNIGRFEIIWLKGGTFALDGGAMFGVVPKLLWKKKYPCDEDNFIPLIAWPMLIRSGDSTILIESGLGNKLTDKQKKIFRIREEWDVISELSSMGLKREDIDYVILTHYDFDHAGGVVMQDSRGELGLTFPDAEHIIQKTEWDDVVSPNVRSINTYWPVNHEQLRDHGRVRLIDGEHEVMKGVKVFLTGGHNRGHQIVRIESEGKAAYHLGDLIPTHAHFNPLWVMAYDNYPLDTVKQKERLEKKAIEENAWFLFYHDPFILACKFDDKGNVIDSVSGRNEGA